MSNSQCMVSVMMVTYNHERYFRQAIESILMQEVDFTYEIIIGDDASTDKTQHIIKEYQKKYPDKIVSILRRNNLGPTRNGYDVKMRCNGKYIAVLEGDDYWIDKKKLKKQVDFLEKNQQYIGCAHNYFRVTEEGSPVKMRYPSNRCYNKKFTMSDFLKGKANRLTQSAAFVYKNIYKDSDCDYTIFYRAHPMIGDGTILSLLLDRGDFYLFPEKMTAHRTRRRADADNVVSIMSKNPLEYSKSVLKYTDNLEDFFDQKYNFNFTRRIGIDFSLQQYKLLEQAERKELMAIIRALKLKEQLLCYARLIKNKARHCILYIPKKIVRW